MEFYFPQNIIGGFGWRQEFPQQSFNEILVSAGLAQLSLANCANNANFGSCLSRYNNVNPAKALYLCTHTKAPENSAIFA